MRRYIPAAVLLSSLAFSPVAAEPLPTVETGGTVSVYAAFPTDPGTISFDDSDNLFVGNLNNPGPPDVPTTIWRVAPLDSLPTPCATIDDPDAVYVDRHGLISSPGTVLVGGWQYGTSIGQIRAVPGSCGGSTQVAAGGCLGNINTFAEDALGRLFVSNGSEFTLCVWDGASWSQFLTATPGVPRIAIDGTDIYVSAGDTVRRYNAAGVLIDPAFTTGAVHSIGPSGSVFAGVIVERPNLLVAVNPVTKAETRILSGPGSTGLGVAFDSSGDLYISQGGVFDRVLHVTQATTTGVVPAPDASAGSLLEVSPNPATIRATVRFRSRTSGPVRLDLLDAGGRRVMGVYDEVLSDGGFSGNIDLTHLARGVYFVSAQTQEGTTTEKIVLVR